MTPWQTIYKNNIKTSKQLIEFLGLDNACAQTILQKSSFALNLPKRLAKKIDVKNILSDPIFLQFVPQVQENHKKANFSNDPVGEMQIKSSAAPRLLVKYCKRALLTTTQACAMHCRYCFRREYDYSAPKGFSAEIAQIKEDPSLKEVILSGGDPLSLPNHTLKSLIDDLSSIAHLTRLRFHTRFAIGIPERIDSAFLQILEQTRLKVWFVIHLNHPVELDADVIAALAKVQKLGICVLNQAVLLKGVNDSIEVLEELAEKLIDAGILPYYLHQLDRVQGAAHFEVDPARGVELIEQLRTKTSGFGVFKYVQEVAAKASKLPIFKL